MKYKQLLFLLFIPHLLLASLKQDIDTTSKQTYDEALFQTYPYYECFKESSVKHDIPMHILLGIAKGESNFNYKAVSKANAVGVMQIQWPGTAKDLGFKKRDDLYNPCRNVKAGSKYFRWLLNRYDDNYYYALAAYNYGPGRIKLNSSIPKGAKWYVAYIHDKTQSVVDKKYALKGVYDYFVFDHFYYAKNFLKHLNKTFKNKVDFEVFKLDDKYTIRFTYNTYQEKIKLLSDIESKTGVKPIGKR